MCVFFFNGNDGVVGLTYIFIKLRFFLFLLAGVLIRQDLGLFFLYYYLNRFPIWAEHFLVP